MEFLAKHLDEILLFLFGISELMASIPWIKANSVFQLITNIIKKLLGKSDQSSS